MKQRKIFIFIVLLICGTSNSYCQDSITSLIFECTCEDSVTNLVINYGRVDEKYLVYEISTPSKWASRFYLSIDGDEISLMEHVKSEDSIVIIATDSVDVNFRRVHFPNGLRVVSVKSKGDGTASFTGVTRYGSSFVSELSINSSGLVQSIDYFDGFRNFKCISNN